MTEIAARLGRSPGPLRALQLAAALAGLALVAVGVAVLRPHAAPAVHAHTRPVAVPGTKRGAAAHEAFQSAAAAAAARARLAATLGADAARGLDRGFFTSSPGGVLATAERVARWRPLAVRAARGSGFAPKLLEGIVFVESSGRSQAIGGRDVSGPAGLTQLSARTARRLHLHVGVVASRRLTHEINAATRSGRYRTAHALIARRRHVDERFAPLKSLRATVHYLIAARNALGRADLAVESYEAGIGSLRRAIAASGLEDPTYAALYFGSSPLRHAAVWRRLTRLGDVSADFYWKVLAAQHVLHLYRRDASALVYESRLEANKNSAEEVLHPRSITPRFATPDAIARARKHHVLRAIPRDARATHIRVGAFVGQEAHALGRSRRLYRALRPQTLDVLLYIGRQVHELSRARRPLILTSAVRDNRYQRVLMNVNVNAARSYSLHTTGYAFDIARVYASRRQAAAFQFVLDRLQSVNAIAYITEAAAIHIAVASDAPAKLKLLARAGARPAM